MRVEREQRTVEQRRFHRLSEAAALAFVQRHQDADHSVQARGHIDDGHADAGGFTLRIAVDAHESAERLNGSVVARQSAERAGRAKAGDAAVDQPGKARAQHIVVAHAPALQRADLEVFDQHIGVFEQLEHHLAPGRVGHVHAYRALVAVDASEIRGHACVVERRTPGAGLVAFGAFDLDDVRAMVAQNLRTQRAAQNAREIDDFQSIE